jgi:hypothetical protein
MKNANKTVTIAIIFSNVVLAKIFPIVFRTNKISNIHRKKSSRP